MVTWGGYRDLVFLLSYVTHPQTAFRYNILAQTLFHAPLKIKGNATICSYAD